MGTGASAKSKDERTSEDGDLFRKLRAEYDEKAADGADNGEIFSTIQRRDLDRASQTRINAFSKKGRGLGRTMTTPQIHALDAGGAGGLAPDATVLLTGTSSPLKERRKLTKSHSAWDAAAVGGSASTVIVGGRSGARVRRQRQAVHYEISECVARACCRAVRPSHVDSQSTGQIKITTSFDLIASIRSRAASGLPPARSNRDRIHSRSPPRPGTTGTTTTRAARRAAACG